MSHLAVVALSGALAVALGAFGAHGLEGAIPAERLETFKTANLYHFLHTIVLLALVLAAGNTGTFDKSKLFLGLGVIIFSGSLYLLATRGLIGLESARWLGAITPIGGVLFIVGWVYIMIEGRNLMN